VILIIYYETFILNSYVIKSDVELIRDILSDDALSTTVVHEGNTTREEHDVLENYPSDEYNTTNYAKKYGIPALIIAGTQNGVSFKHGIWQGNDFTMKKSQESKLEYIHIAKTGGSSIEMLASFANITWGICHYIFRKRGSYGEGCKHPDMPIQRVNMTMLPFDKLPETFKRKRSIGETWHTPFHWLNNAPFRGDKKFTVVRDPYSRIVSQYFCIYKGYQGIKQCSKTGCKRNITEMNRPTVMNEWIQNLLSDDERMKWAHFLPQHYYVFDQDGNRIIDHILRIENLQSEFADLMNQYRLNISLPDKKSNARKRYFNLTVKDLEIDTIQSINSVFREDFEKLNYTMIHHSVDD